MTDPETITRDDLAEALDGFWLHIACGGQRVHGQVADPGEVASVLLATVGRIAAERSGEPGPPVAAGLDGPTIAAEPCGEAGLGDDPSQGLTTADVSARAHPGPVPALPLGAAFDPAAVRGLIAAALDPGSPAGAVTDAVMAVIWPLLEHAQDAAAGSHEGIRLWMIDCGELVAKHRARAGAAERKLAGIDRLVRDGKAQGRLWLIADRLADEILAITGTKEESRG